MTTRTATKPYSVAEANRALPLVRSIVQDVVAEFTKLRELGRERRALEAQGSRSARAREMTTSESGLKEAEARQRSDDLKQQMDDGALHIDGYIRELAELGCELKDPERGLIDFPSERAGRPIWLCWKIGEDAVAHWHALDETYADRRAIDGSVKRERRQAEGTAP